MPQKHHLPVGCHAVALVQHALVDGQLQQGFFGLVFGRHELVVQQQHIVRKRMTQRVQTARHPRGAAFMTGQCNLAQGMLLHQKHIAPAGKARTRLAREQEMPRQLAQMEFSLVFGLPLPLSQQLLTQGVSTQSQQPVVHGRCAVNGHCSGGVGRVGGPLCE